MRASKQILIGFVSFLLVSLFVLCILFMIHVKKTDSIVLEDDLTCLYRENVTADRFIKSIDGELLDKYLVDTSHVGKRRVEIQYKNRYGFVEHFRFDIEVLDKTEPIINIKNPFILKVSEVNRLEDVLFCADDYDDGISCKIEGEYNLNQVGNYDIHVSSQDKSGNKSEKDVTLKIVNDLDDNQEVQSIMFKDVLKKYGNESTLVGVDISKWQGDVDYSLLSKAGVSFVMLKIGGQDRISGDIIMDPYFTKNIEGALQNGIDVGVYFYSHAKNVDMARKQARWVIQNIRNYNITLPIAFDWENWEKYPTYGIGFRSLNKIADGFISEVKRYNYDSVLYSSKYYLDNVWYSENYSKWIAYYNNQFKFTDDYVMWQMSNHGKVDGINGEVDIDILNKNNIK